MAETTLLSSCGRWRPDYFGHWLRSGEARQRIALTAQGSVRNVVSFGDLGSIIIPVPTLDRQKNISRVLNAGREELCLINAEIEALTHQKRGLMQKLLTGKWRVPLNPADAFPATQENSHAVKKNYWTQKRPDGKWESKRKGATRTSKVTNTQASAWSHSKQKAAQTQGEAFLKSRDGKIRERNPYGKDPHPPKG